MQILALVGSLFLIVIGLLYWVGVGVKRAVGWWCDCRRRRIRRIEAELDRTQAEMRATILHLAEQLGADAHEARKALIRESYVASGQTPPPE